MMSFILKSSVNIILFMRFELFQVLFFVIWDIFDESVSRLIFLLFLVKVIALILGTSSKSDSVVSESVTLFLSKFRHFNTISLLLLVINDLEFRILTDDECLWCLYFLRHPDSVLEVFLNVWLHLVDEPFELVGPTIFVEFLLIREFLLFEKLIEKLLFLINFLLDHLLFRLLFLFRLTHLY